VLLTAAYMATVRSTPYIKEHDLLIGVYQPNSPGSYNQIDAFTQAAGFNPRITSYYSTFTQPFATAFAEEAAGHGTQVLVQWQPRGTTSAAIASGTQDAYITAFAQQVALIDNQVIISYGQEMNGNWYDWGTAPGDVATSTPADYIAAYRHIWNLFHTLGVHNVTWLWGPNVSYTGSTPLASLYPGDQYVDWVGLDGYFSTPAATFASLFAPSIAELRAFTHKPLLIAESGTTGTAGPAQLTSLFQGASLTGAVGLVYFDEEQNGDAMHQDWRLENNPANMAAFAQLVQIYAERPLTWPLG
jgi:mannan endo-1,4-beta-mannosidase